ncbi:glycosyltransferase [Patescibacteria group bacterium]|nr:glycosyltransferase [Patescibacteria group bacterium]
MKEKIIVITTYPPKGSIYNHPYSAVASYSKKTLLSSMQKDKSLNYVVLADKLEGRQEYFEDGIKVKRIWDRNKPWLFFQILKEILREKNAPKVFVAFEWAIFGNNKFLLAGVPLLLLILRLLQKKIYFISHGILTDANQAVEQLGIKKGSLTAEVYSLALKTLYYLAINLSHKTVAFEEVLRGQALKFTSDRSRVVTIAHGVEPNGKVSPKKEALLRLKLNNLKIKEDDFVVLCFGFLTWYKGSDWLVKTLGKYFFQDKKTNIKLIMAGGPAKNHEEDPVYKKFTNDIYKTARKAGRNIEITGFVDESKISDYFNISDLVVLPYRIFVSSSGPLSIAFSYKKPVIFSEPLSGYCLSLDIKEALGKSQLKMEELVFDLEAKDLINKIKEVSESKTLQRKMKTFSKIMSEKRSWPAIGEKYAYLLKN